MAAAPIDLSAGLVPKAQSGPIDLSAGLVPKSAPAPAPVRLTPQPTGVTVQAHNPSLMDRLRGVVANSAIGHSLEQSLPGVADALNLHPTETVYSPTYESDKHQLLAPQYLMPGNPESKTGNVVKGALQGTGELTSGKNLATGAAIAATGGLIAPAATGTGAAAFGARLASRAVPAAGVVLGGKQAIHDVGAARKQFQAGDEAGGLQTLGAAIPNAALTIPGLYEGASAGAGAVGDAAVGHLRSGLDEPIAPGSDLTPRQRYQAAQRLGVNLDAADATNNTALNLVKKANQHSLLGSPLYERKAAENAAALDQSATGMLHDMSPLGRQDSGNVLSSSLKKDMSGLRTGAENGFDYLHEMTGGAPVPGAAAVGTTARQILDENAPFWERYPSMEPRTAVSALRDLSKVGDTATYPELQRLRSNTLELTNANPDLVKDDGTGMLQRMTGSLDSAITENGLTPAQSKVFRDANAQWAELKSTYDDPSSPLYHAVRTDNPDTLAANLTGGAGKKTVSQIQDLRPRIGEEGVGALQRHVAEDALGSTNDGSYNFKGFGIRLNRIPDDYRSELFGEKNRSLDDLATTANLLHRDANPSGTAKLGQKIGEGAALLAAPVHPLGAAGVAVQYPFARLMNSPRFVEMLMREPGAAGGGGLTPPVLPGGGGDPKRYQDDAYGPGGVDAHIDRQAAQTPVRLKPGLRDLTTAAPKAPYLGSAPKPGQVVEGLDGAETQLHTPSGVLPAKYRVVEADSLTPSHNAQNFRANPAYPAGVQERDYASQKENQLRVITNARNYKPELTINDNPDGVNGPPVVTPDGIVLGGNSRTMSTQRLYADDGRPYKEMLAKKAASFGVDPAQVAGMKQPILVREVTPSGGVEGMRRLASDLNKPLTGSMGGSERAVSMGKSVSPTTLNAVQTMIDEMGNSGKEPSLREVLSDPARANNFLQKMQADGIITAAERPQYVDTATGGMTEEGKRLFERALLGSAIGDSAVMDAAPKSILQKLSASIGPISSLAARGDEWNILPEIQRAIVEHGKMASSGLNVDDYFNQRSLFDSDIIPAEEQMTRLLAKNPNEVRDALATFARDARQSPEGQASFLGPTPEAAWTHAFGPLLTRK